MRETLVRLSSLASRYGGLLAQFAIVILIARHMPKDDAGIYLMMFGAVTSTSVLAGFGAPDALIKRVPELMQDGRGALARREVAHCARFTAWTSAALLAALALAGLLLGIDGQAILLFAPWWAGYAVLFFCGQALVALGRPRLGAFLFYALNNLLLMVTTAPYLLIAARPDAAGALASSILAIALAALAGGALVAREVRRLPMGGELDPVAPARALGLLIALARVLQAVLYWIPGWVILSVRGPADAAIIGTAGRLLIAATAVMAVFRFTIRNPIVRASARGDRAAMEKMARAAATIGTVLSILALLVILAVGRPLIGFVFGAPFAAAAPVLAVLLIGAIGESIGGPVDELLKYNGLATPVLIGLAVTAALETLLAFGLAPFGPQWAALAQAIAFTGMYAYQIILCRMRLGITILPYTSPARLRAGLRAAGMEAKG